MLPGPHAAPDFFTPDDIAMLHTTEWEVHHHSDRTGVRLLGPAPQWARPDGGEAGLHPSNIHDNEYAIGTIDFTGDMPIVLGPDGPSLGGFVCPATVASADRWKLGQLRAGDRVRLARDHARRRARARRTQRARASRRSGGDRAARATAPPPARPAEPDARGAALRPGRRDPARADDPARRRRARARRVRAERARPRPAGARPRAARGAGAAARRRRRRARARHPFAAGALRPDASSRSTRCSRRSSTPRRRCPTLDQIEIPSRIVHLPLAWNDSQTQLAIERYQRSVAADAPWCPSNLEFIRRINGLDSIDDVHRIVFDASYLVLGLGDVYLGAPVATPVDPRHRLVTTKYNPARTWTPENAVGIGGAYLCVYGMEGPGGYQFVGRTVQVWNRWHSPRGFEPGRPWLLRFFDQLRFHPGERGGAARPARRRSRTAQAAIDIEPTVFRMADYHAFLDDARRRDRGVPHPARRTRSPRSAPGGSGSVSRSTSSAVPEPEPVGDEPPLAAGEHAVAAPVQGTVWRMLVAPGDTVARGRRGRGRRGDEDRGVGQHAHARVGSRPFAARKARSCAPVRPGGAGMTIEHHNERAAPGPTACTRRWSGCARSTTTRSSSPSSTTQAVASTRGPARSRRPARPPAVGNADARQGQHRGRGRTDERRVPGVRDRPRRPSRPRSSSARGRRARSCSAPRTWISSRPDSSGRARRTALPRNPAAPGRIPGGSSSGSAVAVARGLVPFALGTDTAGSGRVPAACTNTVGVKPTRGLVSTRGVVPAVPGLDCISVHALTVADAFRVLTAIGGFDARDPWSRRDAAVARTRPHVPVVGWIADAVIDAECEGAVARAYCDTRTIVAGLAGARGVDVDPAPFFAAGAQLYGPWVAARYAAFGAFVDAHPDAVDPVVAGIVARGPRRSPASTCSRRRRELARAAARGRRGVRGRRRARSCRRSRSSRRVDEVAADPIGVNARLVALHRLRQPARPAARSRCRARRAPTDCRSASP